MMKGFKPSLPARLVNAEFYERAQWHTEQADKHADKVLEARNKQICDLHELAFKYHEEWAEYWNDLYEAVENAILEARNEYEGNTTRPKVPRRLKNSNNTKL